jgi:phosphodiesterase/alkaline phosphatase D-like protein
MSKITRRKFIELAALFSATLAWRSGRAFSSQIHWREGREFFPQGVASADPYPDSVIVWTRRPPVTGSVAKKLIVEIAEDSDFRKTIAASEASLSHAIDTAVVASGPRVVDMYVLRACVGEESPEMFFQLTSVRHFRNQHHPRRVIPTNG